jgi:Iron-containing redox enzyme
METDTAALQGVIGTALSGGVDLVGRAFPSGGEGEPAARLEVLRHLHGYYSAYLAGAQDFERIPHLNTDPAIREIERAWHAAAESRIDLADLPGSADEFRDWFLATAANHEQPDFCRYLEHEATGPEIALFIAAEELVDGRFDDLVAMVGVGISGAAKMTIAENYWDEMGRGEPGQVHTTLFASSGAYMSNVLAAHGAGTDGLECAEIYENACLLMSYAIHRHLIPRALGAMGVLEQSASPRFEAMVRGCARTGAPDNVIEYQRLHIDVDANHGKEWFENVLMALAETSPTVRREICIGVRARVDVADAYYRAIWHRMRQLRAALAEPS